MDIWEKSLNHIKEKVSSQNFITWFKPIRLIGINGRVVELGVPNRFFEDWIRENYMDILREGLLNGGLEDGFEISFNILSKTESKGSVKRQALESRPSAKITNHQFENRIRAFNLDPKYTFENFVVGKSNEFAHAACSAVANNPSTMYNPLFIYGGVGLGKTHLLQAIGYRALSKRNNIKVCYYSAEMFMNELINSIRFEKMVEFRRKFREMDILLIDDIQFIAGKERTQEEFFHTFNSLHSSHSQIVVTSDKFPKDIAGLEERLRTRFEWGLIADIQPPEMETKVAILKKKAEMDGITLPDDVAFYLAGIVDSNIRELEGYLVRVLAYSSLTGREISLPMAKDVLKNLLRGREKVITVNDVQKAVCKFFNIKTTELKSKKRLKNIALPRQIAMYLSRECTNSSFPEIGDKFGGKDHSTVIHGYQKIKKTIESDQQLNKTVESIKTLLYKS